jgi:hypothetical protein
MWSYSAVRAAIHLALTTVGCQLLPVLLAQKPQVAEAPGAKTAFQSSGVAVSWLPLCVILAFQMLDVVDW